MATPDDFAAEHLEMAAMPGKGLIGEPVLQQINQEGFDEHDEASADGAIAVLNLPELRPD